MTGLPNIEAATRALAAYIQTTITGLKEVTTNFPDPTVALKYPSISVVNQGPPLLLDLAGATVLSKSAIYSDGTVDDDGTTRPKRYIDIVFLVGQYDFTFQLDLWCQSKSQREDLYQKLYEALNPAIYPMGLSLTLEEYHNQKCHYQMQGYNNDPDGNTSADRGTWRTLVKITATCNAVRAKKEYVMETLESTVEILDTNEEDISLNTEGE